MSATFQKIKGAISNLDPRQLYQSGCIDIIVVEQPNGRFKSTPFHVRFGQFAGRQCVIDLFINDQPTQVRMSVDKSGSGYFENKQASGYQSDDAMSEVQSQISDEIDQAKYMQLQDILMDKIDKKNSNWFQSLKFWRREKKQINIPISSPRNDTQISLCGNNEAEFDNMRVSYSQFEQNYYNIVQDPSLVFKIQNKIYPREVGLAKILSQFIFQQELSLKTPSRTQLSKSSERVRKMSEDSTSSSFRKRGRKHITRPNTEQLAQLNLKYGANKITYKVLSEGKKELTANIFLFKQDTKIVISDIDGTITKSDLLGQLMPKLGSDWTHEGVAQLYQGIKERGYQIMYLTARAIGQVDQTKEFIYNLKQGNVSLPFGPIITSPDSLLPAFKREVIDGIPEQFKITALKEIRNLFIGPPFFSGFGNRVTDATAYNAVNVDVGRIYIVDTDSRIHIYDSNETTSYTEMNQNLDLYFPAVSDEQFKIQNFWKLPLQDFDINL